MAQSNVFALVRKTLGWLKSEIDLKQPKILSADYAMADEYAAIVAGTDTVEVAIGKLEKAITAEIADRGNALDALDATERSGLTDADALDTGKHVGVKVVQEDGLITGVTVVEGDIASADALKDFMAEVKGGEKADGSEIAEENSIKGVLEQAIEDAAEGNNDALTDFIAEVKGGEKANGDTIAEAASIKGVLEAAIAQEAEDRADAIEALDATVRGSLTEADAVAEGKHVGVKVVEEDGVITGVTVVEDDIASAAALADLVELVGAGELAEGEDDLITRIGALEDSIGDGGDIESRIDDLEENLGVPSAEGQEATGLNKKVEDLAAEYADDKVTFVKSVALSGDVSATAVAASEENGGAITLVTTVDSVDAANIVSVSGSKLSVDVIPAVALSTLYVAASEEAKEALTTEVEVGDTVKVGDKLYYVVSTAEDGKHTYADYNAEADWSTITNIPAKVATLGSETGYVAGTDVKLTAVPTPIADGASNAIAANDTLDVIVAKLQSQMTKGNDAATTLSDAYVSSNDYTGVAHNIAAGDSFETAIQELDNECDQILAAFADFATENSIDVTPAA